MKVRLGFVSNSSSSSFVIASKKGELTREKLIKAFGVDKKSLFYSTSVKMAECLVDNSEKRSKKDLIEDNYCKCEEELPKEIQKALKLGLVYTGSVANDNGSIEELLCDFSFNYEDEEIYLWKEEGF